MIVTFGNMYKKTIAYLLMAAVAIFATSVCGKESKKSVLGSLEEKMQDESNPLVLMKTSKGNIYIELYKKAAPETVDNFTGLAEGAKEFTEPQSNSRVKRPFFNGLIFHRVIPNFMIQGGDLLGNGSGGPGYRFQDEINADALGLDKVKVKDNQYYQNDAAGMVFQKLQIKSNEERMKRMKEIKAEFDKISELPVKTVLEARGYIFDSSLPSVPMNKYTIAMANAGPNTNGSQFFINVVDNPYLNGKHTVFGKVVKGRKVCEDISKVEKDNRDKPVNDVVIQEVIVLK